MSPDFRLGEWTVRPLLRTIERGDNSVHVKPKAMSVLECLAAANGNPVTRSELFDQVWPGGEVTDDTLTKCIVELRRAFGDTAHDSRVIETIHKLGFRLLLPVEPLEAEPPPIHRRELRLAGLLLIAAILAMAVLLLFDSPRMWFTETTNTPLPANSQTSSRQTGIAVLPFVNMSGDSADEYFSLGVSEEILNALAATNRFPVIARTSSFQFNSDGRNIKEIGRLLNVSHVLEGSVRKAQGTVRISTQLIDTQTGTHVWADVYQRELTDIFQLQVDITRQVVEQISRALKGESTNASGSPERVELETVRHTDSIEAYELYLVGTQLLSSYDPIPVEQAAEYFDRAIDLDANYADAWAGKGRAMHVLGLGNRGHPHMPADVFPQAIAAYRRALEIEPRHASAMGWLGIMLMVNDFQWAEGLETMRLSLDINPNNASMLSRYGAWLQRLGLEGSEEILQRAFRLDPFGFVTTQVRTGHLQRQGRWLDAATVAESTLVGNRNGYVPNSFAAFMNLGACAMGNLDEPTREARLEAAEAQIRRARRVAHPVDFSLDFMEQVVAGLRNNTPIPWREALDRAKTERLDRLALYFYSNRWEDEPMIVEAFDLAIEQRDAELWLLFGTPPAHMPEEDWQRFREITGVSQFQSAR